MVNGESDELASCARRLWLRSQPCSLSPVATSLSPARSRTRPCGRASNPATSRALPIRYLDDMDGGIKLDDHERAGRIAWVIWSGGNDRFWDYMANNTFGAFDLLKILSSNPHVGYCVDPSGKPFERSSYSELSEAQCKAKGLHWFTPSRGNRFDWYGLVNEPCFEQANGPDQYGLWLDTRTGKGKGCDKPDPFASEKDYPGVKIGARGKTVPVGSYYGKPSGIVGLRLFPNPDFDEAAKEEMDGGAQEISERGRLLHRQGLLQQQAPDPTLSRRHVLRLLPCRPVAVQPAEGSGKSAMGQFELQPGRAIFLGRPHLHLEPASGAVELHLPALPHLQARHARHFLRVDRQHQQSAHHERRLRAGGAPEDRRMVEGEARRRRPRQQAVLRVSADQEGDRRLQAARSVPLARHGLHAARAQGRLGFGRRARRAQPRLSQYRPVQRGMAAALPRR